MIFRFQPFLFQVPSILTFAEFCDVIIVRIALAEKMLPPSTEGDFQTITVREVDQLTGFEMK